MIMRRLLLFAGLWTAAPAMAAGSDTEADHRPNIVFILADDLGWADTTLGFLKPTTLTFTTHWCCISKRAECSIRNHAWRFCSVWSYASQGTNPGMSSRGRATKSRCQLSMTAKAAR